MFELRGRYTNAKVFAEQVENEAISQIMGMCNHPAFKDAKIAIMSDVHAGDSCTIGTTATLKEKKIIPNIVGGDIACGVWCSVFKINGKIDFKKLDDFVNENIPSGHDIRTDIHPSIKKEIIDEIEATNDELHLENLDLFLKSVGTLGGGNHFISIDIVDENTFALFIHTGSRHLGKKVCEYFQKLAIKNIDDKKKNKRREDCNEIIARLKKEHREKEISKELEKFIKNSANEQSGIPKNMSYIEGNDYESYIKYSIFCAHIAHESRRLIALDILTFINNTFGKVDIVEEFDTIHNYVEQNDSGEVTIRKGAISAKLGEKISIPLNMKDGVIIAIGKGNDDWNQSAPHGAGRQLSRSKAKQMLSIDDYKAKMVGINTWSVCLETLDEAPDAYKSAESIISQVKDTCDIVCVTKPIYNFKAHSPETPIYRK